MLQATRRNVTPSAGFPLPEAEAWYRHGSLLLFAMALLAFGFVVIAAGAKLLSRGPVAAIQVEGELRHSDRGEIAARLAPLMQGDYFSIDLDAIRQAAATSPWVDEVRVSRRWPDGVRVQIREKQAVARWGQKGLVSSRGDLFVPPVMEDGRELPVLFGPASKGIYVMEQYRAMNNILRGVGMRVVELELTDRMSWFLRLDNGIRLVVDQADTIEKMQRFAYLYERQLRPDVNMIASVDLRYRNGVSVAWKEKDFAKKSLPRV